MALNQYTSTTLADPNAEELAGINRQQALANALMTQGLQGQPQGQMISGYYVKPSITQALNPVAQQLAGSYLGKQADIKAQELANAIRQAKGTKEEAITNLITGTPEKTTELAGPYTGNIPMPTAYQAARGPDLSGALKEIATNNPYGAGSEYKAAIIGNMIPKTPDEVAKYKYAQTPEGGGFKGTFEQFQNQMNEFQRKSLALQAAAQNKPQIIETANGFVAVNPNNPSQATPVMFNGKPVMGNKGALQGEGAKQVIGANNLKDAVTNYQNTLKDFSTFDLVNPDARAKMGQAYNNMILQAKEAYNLGVLNGNDYKILTSIVADPTAASSLLVGKNTLMGQADELAKTANKIIGNVYETHQKPLPANMQTPASSSTPQIDPQLLQFMTPEQQALFKPQGK